MHAIIPVAGVGSRLRPHTYTLPKVLLNVAGKPILGHILERLLSDGITSATIVVGYMGDLVERYVRDHFPSLKVNFVTQEELLGLGHSIWVAREYIPTDGTPLFIILGDTIFDVDLKPVFASGVNSLGVKVVDDPRRFGVANVSSGYISQLVEKPDRPTSNLAVVGLYFIKNPKLLRASLEEIVSKDKRTKGEYQLTDALQLMIDRGEKFSTFTVDGWYDCGKPETLLATNRQLLQRIAPPREIPGSVIIPPVYIAPNAEITNSIIGPYATIGLGAKVNDSIVRGSIIGDDSSVAGVLLDNSIVGNNADVKGGFKRINAGDSSEIDFQ
ncbi:MAG TPA: sugar phosphate nucleotidyltransferase [Candidatus Kapabacteria bacterium]|nr:sugar phosphate nucleotidyltransferase [Candidatus Kapabacteria bacterium]